MPTKFIPIGEWRPDLGEFRKADLFLRECQGFVPLGEGLHFCGELETLADEAGSDNFDGLHVHPLSTSTYMIYVSQDTELLQIDPQSSYAVTNVTGGPYVSAFEPGWQFTSFGRHIIAVNYNALPQIQLDGSGDFQDMITAGGTVDLKAKFVATVKNHVVLANYEENGVEYPDGVWWSQTDNARGFSTPDLDDAI